MHTFALSNSKRQVRRQSVSFIGNDVAWLPEKQKAMNVDNAKSQMRKGMLEYCVLLLLSREASYANDIIARLKDAELIVVEGTLYPLLTRLKKDGLLSYEWRESTQGPPRKYYKLTDEGIAFLEELDFAWNELARTVRLLKGRTPILSAGV